MNVAQPKIPIQLTKLLFCPNINNVPLGKNFHHVYNLAMSEPVTQTHEYREAFQYLKMSERIGLIETLTTFSQSLRKNGKLHCTQSYTYLYTRCLMVSTNQADPSCFYFKIS